MSEGKYTQGRLKAEGHGVVNDKRTMKATIIGADCEAEANADRIALCWNSHDHLTELLYRANCLEAVILKHIPQVPVDVHSDWMKFRAALEAAGEEV